MDHTLDPDKAQLYQKYVKVIKIPGETPSSKPVIHKINLVIDGATFSDDARFKTFLDMLSESESKY